MYSLFVKHYLFKQTHLRGKIFENNDLKSNLINAEKQAYNVLTKFNRYVLQVPGYHVLVD